MYIQIWFPQYGDRFRSIPGTGFLLIQTSSRLCPENLNTSSAYPELGSSVYKPVPRYARNWVPQSTDQFGAIYRTGFLRIKASSAPYPKLGSSVQRAFLRIKTTFAQYPEVISPMTMERPVMRYILTDRMNVWSEWIHRSPAQVIKATFYHCFRLKILYASISCVQKGTTNRLHF